jgi:hypothetical protein
LEEVHDNRKKGHRLLGGQLMAEMVRNHIYMTSHCVGAFRGFVAISFSIMSRVEFRRMLAEFGLVASLEWVQASLDRKCALFREAREDDGAEGGLVIHGADNVGMQGAHGGRVEYVGLYEKKVSQAVRSLPLPPPPSPPVYHATTLMHTHTHMNIS